jgi:PAS domain S-box-containing protein
MDSEKPRRDLTDAAETAQGGDRAALFQAIANYTYDWESWIGTDGRPLWINPAVERLTGYGVQECLAMPAYPLELVESVDRQAVKALLVDAAAGGSGNDIEFRVRRKDGALAWAALSYQTIRDEAGSSLGYRTSCRDITRRKRAEAALMEAQREAERANRAKSRFLAAAGHDLSQPLQAIAMFASALKAQVSDAEGRDSIDAIQQSLRAADELLSALLEVARLDAGTLKPQPQAFAACDLLERIETSYAPQAREKSLAFRIVPCSVPVVSDPALLGRILGNLVSNAIRYTERGAVLVGCRRRGQMLRIEVWDTGIGIPESKWGAIFEEFYQIGNPERDRRRGLGLGLAVVDRLAKLLGHGIELRSRVGRGSMFAVVVPIGSPDLLSPKVPRPDGALDVSGALVVVIDDEPVQREGMRRALGAWGCSVVPAASAEDALAQLAGSGRKPDLIVADYRLADGATGSEAIRRLSDWAERPIPGIIVSGDNEAWRLQEVAAGGYGFLHKPVDPDELRRRLAAVLRAGGR